MRVGKKGQKRGRKVLLSLKIVVQQSITAASMSMPRSQDVHVGIEGTVILQDQLFGEQVWNNGDRVELFDLFALCMRPTRIAQRQTGQDRMSDLVLSVMLCPIAPKSAKVDRMRQVGNLLPDGFVRALRRVSDTERYEDISRDWAMC